MLGNDNDLKSTDCGTIHNAQFCIKHVGRYEGENQRVTEILRNIKLKILSNTNYINSASISMY